MSEKVVVIGGGYAGIEAAISLDKTFDVTLVAGGDCFRHIVYGLRASTLPEETPRMLPAYDNMLKNGTVKKCKASKINAEESTVTLATGESLPYDFLILATGILHPKTVGVGNNAETAAGIKKVMDQANSELKAAQKVLVIGGGPIGIEMAGEIMEEMPGKTVTLVTSKELMPSPNVAFPDKFRARLKAKLEKVGVTVHTDVGRISVNKEDIDECGFIAGLKTYSWAGGEMEADLCIVCIGATEPSSLYADSGLDFWLNEKGQVKVDDTLEVKDAPGWGRVFAIGDCIDLPVPKIAYLAGEMGKSVAKQVAASAAGKPLKSAKPSALPVSLVPVGKSGGVSTFPMGIVVGDWVTRKAKSADMFCAKYWTELKAGKAPPAGV
eukprot:g9385.t1